MKINLDLERKEKYILACSYGPDSMALFNLLLENNIFFVVAHVNYHILTNADEDEKKLREYCEKHNIKIYVYSMYFDKKMGNEEGVAREIRYTFFKNLAKTLDIPNILIAHNLNDSVETYFLQKERNNYVNCYGLSSYYTKNGVNMIRPLLNYFKSDLEEYCKDNNIPYSIDYSNFDQSYRRNYFRHSVVNNLSKEEILSINNEIKSLNLKKEMQKLRVFKYLSDDFINFKEIEDLPFSDFQCLIYQYMDKYDIVSDVTKGFIEDFYDKCKFHKGTFVSKINDVFFECSYKKIIIYKEKNLISYKLDFNQELIDQKMFKINTNSPLFKQISLQNPYIIKNLSKDDKYLIKDYYKPINRLFIDWKMPYCLRKVWPGIYDKDGKLIYTPRYRENYKVNDDSILIFNSTKLIKR